MSKVNHKDYSREYFGLQKMRYMRRDEWAKRRLRDVLSVVELSQQDFIIDLGCGIGTFAIECAKRDCIVGGLDYSKVALDIAKKLLSLNKIRDRVDLINADVDALPLINGLADKVICADLIEHLYYEQFEAMLQEVKRILKDGGELIIYTPNPQNIVSLLPVWLKKIVRFLTKRPKLDDDQMYKRKRIEEIDRRYNYLHVHLKKLNEITRSLTLWGFKIKVKRFTRTGFPALERMPVVRGLFGGHILIKLSNQRRNKV